MYESASVFEHTTSESWDKVCQVMDHAGRRIKMQYLEQEFVSVSKAFPKSAVS